MVVSLAPFVPSQPDVVNKMLEIAQVSNDDVVYDLGCGDGRILIAAVKDFGAKKAVGYEMRRDLFKKDLENVKNENLEGQIQVFNGNLLDADLSEATIVTLYLTTSGNNKLKPKSSEETSMGTRIVSHDFEFPDWSYTTKENFRGHTIYLYTIPDCLKKGDKPRHSFSFKGLRLFK
jgi:SAM-dependent methyltransferase